VECQRQSLRRESEFLQIQNAWSRLDALQIETAYEQPQRVGGDESKTVSQVTLADPPKRMAKPMRLHSAGHWPEGEVGSTRLHNPDSLAHIRRQSSPLQARRQATEERSKG